MKQITGGLLDRIGVASRSLSRHRRPRKSIFDDQEDEFDEQNSSTVKEIQPERRASSVWPSDRTPPSNRSSSQIRSTRVSSQSSSNEKSREKHSRSSSSGRKPFKVDITINEQSSSEESRMNQLYSENNHDHHHHHHHHHHGLDRSITPLIVPRSTSAMSQVSFRSLRSMSSRMKVRMKSFGQVLESRKPRYELEWSGLRAEYELHLARGSIIERCLVEVELGDEARGKWWIDNVWALADRLSPPLPAVLAEYSATGLLPLLLPLRHTLNFLAIQIPYDSGREDLDRFDQLSQTLSRALWYAQLIEGVIEVVSRSGLVKFELLGLGSVEERQAEGMMTEEEEFEKVSNWNGEIRAKTGSGQVWRGSIKTGTS